MFVEFFRYGSEVDKAQKINEWLGMGIGIFQAGTVLFLNGIVLSTLYYGGYLLTAQELTPGDLMAFLVSTQTIQRSLGQMSLLFGQFVRGMYVCTFENFFCIITIDTKYFLLKIALYFRYVSRCPSIRVHKFRRQYSN